MSGRVVQIYTPGGVSVDVGAECLAFLEVEDIRWLMVMASLMLSVGILNQCRYEFIL